MSAFLVTSPYGPLSYHRWTCDEWRCPRAGGGLSADREVIRAAAREHVEESGHHVTIIDGTNEQLCAMATAVADSEVAT